MKKPAPDAAAAPALTVGPNRARLQVRGRVRVVRAKPGAIARPLSTALRLVRTLNSQL